MDSTRRVKLYALTLVILIVANVPWIVILIKAGENAFVVTACILYLIASAVALPFLYRETIAAHARFCADQNERFTPEQFDSSEDPHE